MAVHSSILAWRVPWAEKSGGLQSVGSQRVRHDWATKRETHTHTHCAFYSYPQKPVRKQAKMISV